MTYWHTSIKYAPKSPYGKLQYSRIDMSYKNNSFPLIVGISSIYMHLCFSYKQDKNKFVSKDRLAKDAKVTIEFIEDECERLVEKGMAERNMFGELRALEPSDKIFTLSSPLSFFDFCQKEVKRKIFSS
ncbi:hypothetical protein [Vibrio diabolicus]|nr:hypothetical protein [Vibrio diabolicus]MCS0310744.1 hypothetical protein [Vibrio diabolicus]